jgi:DNA repair protein RecO (recombination protein O)
MERSIRVQALVLSHNNFGEADRYIKLLTSDRGKISAIARGVRKLSSRKAGHLEPFTWVNAQLSRGNGSAWIIGQVSTLESFSGLVCDLDTTCSAAYVTELADKFTEEEVTSREIYQLTLETIRQLAKGGDESPVLKAFELKLLDLAGYRPQLRNCVRCDAEIQPCDQYFSNAGGGVVCPGCVGKESGARPISMRSLKFFRYYQRNGFRAVCQVGWPQELRAESDSILGDYLTYILERQINSRVFRRKIG